MKNDRASITPWIISEFTADMIDFMVEAFGAVEIPNSRIKNDEGAIIHAVVTIGNSAVMLFDSRPGWPPTPSFLNLYVEDIEKAYRKALELDAKSVTDITTLYFGERVCRIVDPFGNLWWLNERVEEIEPEEIGRRAATPDAKEGISYIQKSLNDALQYQKAYFEETV